MSAEMTCTDIINIRQTLAELKCHTIEYVHNNKEQELKTMLQETIQD